ncbi:RNA polymerase sigma factor (sigma-70 family) [Bradyrhizobium sp. USDA 4341]
MHYRTRAEIQASIKAADHDRTSRSIPRRLRIDPAAFDPGATSAFDAVLSYANKLLGPLPGVRLLKVAAAAGGLRPVIKEMSPADQITAESDVAGMACEIGVLLAEHLDCGLARRMAAGMPDNDVVAFLRICAQLQIRPTLVPIAGDDEAFDREDDAEDDVGGDRLLLSRRTWGNIVISMPDDATTAPEASLEEFDLRRQISMLLARLPPREERVIRMRFGIGDIRAREHTLEEVGQSFGLTRERIRQIEKRALVSLALPGWRRGLQDNLFPSPRASDTRKLGRPTGILRDAIEAKNKRTARNASIDSVEAARIVAARARARAAGLKALAGSKQAEKERFVAAEMVALQTYVASQNAARNAVQVEAAANAALEELIRTASATPGGPTDRERVRIEAEEAWALIKLADMENKLAAARAAHESHKAAQAATQEATEIARAAEMDATEAIAIAERAELEAAKRTEAARRAKQATVDTTSADWDDWMAECQAKLAAKKADREARAATKQAERQARAAAKQEEREARAAAKKAEREARAAAVVAAKQEMKAAAKRAKFEANRAARKAKIEAEKAKRKSRLAAAKQAERQAKRAAKQAQREARAAAKKAEREAKAAAMEAARQKVKAAAKRTKLDAKRAARKAKIEAEQAKRKSRLAAAKQAERQTKSKVESERRALAKIKRERERAKRMSLTEFAQTAVVRRDIAAQLVKIHRLKKATSSDAWVDRHSATRFIERFVSVGEIRRFPHGKETEMVLNLAKVPPALSLPESGAVFYGRAYVMRVSDAFC